MVGRCRVVAAAAGAGLGRGGVDMERERGGNEADNRVQKHAEKETRPEPGDEGGATHCWEVYAGSLRGGRMGVGSGRSEVGRGNLGRAGPIVAY